MQRKNNRSKNSLVFRAHYLLALERSDNVIWELLFRILSQHCFKLNCSFYSIREQWEIIHLYCVRAIILYGWKSIYNEYNLTHFSLHVAYYVKVIINSRLNLFPPSLFCSRICIQTYLLVMFNHLNNENSALYFFWYETLFFLFFSLWCFNYSQYKLEMTLNNWTQILDIFWCFLFSFFFEEIAVLQLRCV